MMGAQSAQIQFQSQPYSNGEIWQFSIFDIEFLDGQKIIVLLQFNQHDIQYTRKECLVNSGKTVVVYNIVDKIVSKGKYKLCLVCLPKSWDYDYEFIIGTPIDIMQQRRETSLSYERWINQLLELAKKIETIIPPPSNPHLDSSFVSSKMQEWHHHLQKLKEEITQKHNTYWVPPDEASAYEIEHILLMIEQLWALQTIRLSQLYHITWQGIPIDEEDIAPEDQEFQAIHLMHDITQEAEHILQKQSLPRNLNEQTLREHLIQFNHLYQELTELFQTCHIQGIEGQEIWDQQAPLLQNEIQLWELESSDYKTSTLAATYKTRDLNLTNSLNELKRNWDDVFSYYHAKIQRKATNINLDLAVQNLQNHIGSLLVIPKKERIVKGEIRRQASSQAQKNLQLMEAYWKELIATIQTQKNLSLFSQWYQTWQAKVEQDLPYLPSWHEVLPEFVSDYQHLRGNIFIRANLEIKMRQLIKAGPNHRQPGELETVQAYIIKSKWAFRLEFPKIKKELARLK